MSDIILSGTIVLNKIKDLIHKYNTCIKLLDDEPDLDSDCCHDTEKELYEMFLHELKNLL